MKLSLTLLLSVGCLFASVDINHASVSELTKLKGIGNSKAVKIVEHIKKNGCFKSENELLKIKGIGKNILAKNKGDITILPCKN